MFRGVEATSLTATQDEHEAWFHTLFGSSPDPSWIVVGKRMVECNQAAVTMFGYEDKQLFLNAHPSQMAPTLQPDGESSFAKAERMLNIADELGLNRFEWRARRMDGLDITTEVTLSKIRFRNQDVIYASARDIGQSQRIEHQMALAVGAMQAVFWEFNHRSGELRYDKSQLSRLGFAAEDVIDNMSDWLSRTHPEDRIDLQTSIQPSIGQKEVVFNTDYRISNLAGEYFWIRSSGLVVERTDDGRSLRAVGMWTNIDTQKRAEALIRESEALHRSIVQDQTEFIARYSPDGTIVFINEIFADFLGRPISQILGSNWRSFVDPEFARIRESQIQSLTLDKPLSMLEIWLDSGIGERRWFQFNHRGRFDENDRLTEIQIVGRDITERKVAETALRESEQQFRTLFESMKEGMQVAEVVYDDDGKPNDLRVVGTNLMYQSMFGTKSNIGSAVDHHLRDLYPSLNEDSLQQRIGVALSGEPCSMEIHSDVTQRWYQIHAYSPRPGQVASLFNDITERKLAEARVEQLAYRDTLTGLPNRGLARDRVEQAIAAAQREGHSLAVLFLDLDNFKNINDSLGHAAGDWLLKETATRLVGPIREIDTVGRLGGDEFLILLPNANVDAAAHVAGKVLQELKPAFFYERRLLNVTASIGIAMYPKDGESFDALLRSADTAMYRAKDEGRNAYRFYTEEMNQVVFQRMVLESNLHRAIERKEFVLNYQPKYDRDGQTLVGMEALIRWNQPDIGMISPGQFIPVAETSGLIAAIGRWVLDDACRQSKAWAIQGLPKVRVAVNISARQFASRNIVEVVTEALKVHGLGGQALEIEITESLLAQDMDYTLEALGALKALGVSIAVDDFGTGYSSLSYLKRFPIDRLKIDQSFVRDLGIDPNDRAIAAAVVTLGHSLGMQVIAEGVETVQQLDILRGMGCNEMQGYFLGRPMPAEAMSVILGRHLISQ